MFAKRDTRLRKAIPVKKRVTLAFWKLATENNYRSIGKMAVEITNEFSKCITEMTSDLKVFPKTERETTEAKIKSLDLVISRYLKFLVPLTVSI